MATAEIIGHHYFSIGVPIQSIQLGKKKTENTTFCPQPWNPHFNLDIKGKKRLN